MERLYPRVFGVGRDLVEDKVLQAQVATLSFVTPAHLGLQPATCEGPRWHAAVAALRRRSIPPCISLYLPVSPCGQAAITALCGRGAPCHPQYHPNPNQDGMSQ